MENGIVPIDNKELLQKLINDYKNNVVNQDKFNEL